MSQTTQYRTDHKPNIEHSNELAQALHAKLDYDQLTNCMRCGFCLPACPTFRETGVEPESPRGRIALMKAVVDGIMEPDASFRHQMDHCLGCRACEPVCPADVKYGQLIEQARDAIEDHPQHGKFVAFLRRIFFRGVFPHYRRVMKLGGLLGFYQRSGLQRVFRKLGLMKLFPGHLREIEQILPTGSGKGLVDALGTIYPAKGEKIATVGMFRGCIMDAMFSSTNIHTVELLSEAGFEVVIPEAQGCCGALHAHSGEQDQARELARRNIDAFRRAGVEYIVSNAGGCGALLVEYDHLLRDDPQYLQDAIWFAERVKDVSALLIERGRVPKFIGKDETVTYQDSCHLRNVMKVSNAPRQLIEQVQGARFIEAKESDRCCGSAGIYNMTQPEMSGQILEHKMEHVNETQARYVLTSNPGCLLQMKLGVQRHPSEHTMEVLHVVDFLHARMCSENKSASE